MKSIMRFSLQHLCRFVVLVTIETEKYSLRNRKSTPNTVQRVTASLSSTGFFKWLSMACSFNSSETQNVLNSICYRRFTSNIHQSSWGKLCWVIHYLRLNGNPTTRPWLWIRSDIGLLKQFFCGIIYLHVVFKLINIRALTSEEKPLVLKFSEPH